MAGYQRLPPGPAAADVLAAALSSASLSPFATLDGQLGDKSVHGGDEPICPRTGSIHIGPSQSKFSRPLEVSVAALLLPGSNKHSTRSHLHS